ncbi:hypothetical protein CJF12_00615 [Chryseobacterium piperi]|uniref:acyltransferase family protein n=1 Tax=Chryseobacterium piperi TaxID=558152 RepID=UPI000BAB1487|nr:acyltransferase [Chryseobacterium piperi]ASW72934.1 hypothetical protein CJF12_00615 [Chryseobacterium piperi]
MKNLFKIQVPESRNFGLDLLRFIAIFTVLISHSISVLPEKYIFIHKFIFDGVLIFFVLSGFLIGRIFIRDFEEGFNLKKMFHFWKRRWWRTLPAYYFTILLILLLNFILSKGIDFNHVAKTFIFIQNITLRNNYFFSESWSLSIEEWFYLILPIGCFFIYFLSKLSIKKILLLFFFSSNMLFTC